MQERLPAAQLRERLFSVLIDACDQVASHPDKSIPDPPGLAELDGYRLGADGIGT